MLSDDDEDMKPLTMEKVHVKDDLHRQILSFGQDLIFAGTRGRVKTPKHVSLSVAVKGLTGSVEVVSMLNKMGHAISYSQVLEVETAFANRQVERDPEGIALPSVIQLHVPAVFCWDNNDICEETLSGSDTTHCTNGIIVQPRTSTCLPEPSIHQLSLHKRRSFKPDPSQTQSMLYVPGVKRNPATEDIDNASIQKSPEVQHSAMTHDFVWFLSRMNLDESLTHIDDNRMQCVPSWAGFNAVLRKHNVPATDVIGYCQVIDSSPTEAATVYTLLKRSVTMAERIGQQDVIVVLDQAIYAKATEIIADKHVEFQKVVLRMGSFHIACNLLHIIGQRFGEAGLKDILAESGVVAVGSIDGVLRGKHYNRAMRSHRIVMEALLRLRWQSFINWLNQQNDTFNKHVIVTMVQNIQTTLNDESINVINTSPEFSALQTSFRQFCQTDRGQTATFWDSYIDLVSLLMRFVRATRESNWDLHLSCVRDILSWVFAYDHTNYSRSLPLYWSQMINLETTHPEAHAQLSSGAFAVQRSSTNGFGKIPVDQTIESTLNRATKTKGGIIGFSTNKCAVQRWMVTAHERAEIIEHARGMSGEANNSSIVHKEASSARMIRDEQDVRCTIETICQWNNPYVASPELICISTGITAPTDVAKDIMDAQKLGEEAAVEFLQNRIACNNVSFYAPIKRMQLKSFKSLNKARKIRAAGNEIILRSDRELFARLVVAAQVRKMDMCHVLEHNLGPLPLSLASQDGSLAKTTKAKLADILWNKVPTHQTTTDCMVHIFDAMALLHSLTNVPETFGELAKLILQVMVHGTSPNNRIDFVCDQYPPISIKEGERMKRKKQDSIIINVTGCQQKCPKQWNRFLADGRNKVRLVEFLFKTWSQEEFAEILGDRSLFMAHGSTCHRMKYTDNHLEVAHVADLESSQEEADTRMFLHAKHAIGAGADSILIHSPDTDVVVLAVYFQSQMGVPLWVKTGTRKKPRFFDTRAIATVIGVDICTALPGMHAFTGTDSTSAFVGRGKSRAFDIIQKDLDHCRTMGELGTNASVSEELNTSCETFTCSLYGSKDTNVNALRYSIFCSKSSQSSQLPPNKDSLQKHIQRANLQAYVWKKALERDPDVPDPVGNGWIMSDGHLEVDWMSLPPAPQILIQLIACKCKKDCRSARCSCVSNNLVCTDACGCGQDCVNKKKDVNVADMDDEIDDDDEDDED